MHEPHHQITRLEPPSIILRHHRHGRRLPLHCGALCLRRQQHLLTLPSDSIAYHRHHRRRWRCHNLGNGDLHRRPLRNPNQPRILQQRLNPSHLLLELSPSPQALQLVGIPQGTIADALAAEKTQNTIPEIRKNRNTETKAKAFLVISTM